MFQIIEDIIAFLKHPGEWLNEHLIKPLITFYNTIKEGLASIVKIITNLPKAITKFIQEIRDGFVKIIDQLKDITINFAGTLKSGLANLIDIIRLKIYYYGEALQNKVINPLRDDFNKVKDKLKDVFDFIDNVVDRVEEMIVHWVEREITFVVDKILNFIEEIW